MKTIDEVASSKQIKVILGEVVKIQDGEYVDLSDNDVIKELNEYLDKILHWHKQELQVCKNNLIDEISKWIKITHNSNWRKKSLLLKKLQELREEV